MEHRPRLAFCHQERKPSLTAILGKILNVLIILAAFLLLPSYEGIGGELRSYDLPSRSYGALPLEQKSASKAKQEIDKSVYEKFALATKKLSPEKKKELILAFSQKRDNAIKNEQWNEVKYYSNLLKILQN